MLFPGVWHRYRPLPESGWNAYWVGFGGPFVEDLVQQEFLTPQSPVVKVSDPQALQDTFCRLMTIATQPVIDNPFRLAAITGEILAVLCEPTEQEAAELSTSPFQRVVQDRIVAEALRLIWNHDDLSLSVNDLVDNLPVSRRSLERRFQKALGRTVLGEITQCRIERAKALLDETDQPLKQLAKATGFSSPEALAKAFHRHFGKPPAAYRRRRTRP
jgi:AraC-like DNA-binding protein